MALNTPGRQSWGWKLPLIVVAMVAIVGTQSLVPHVSNASSPAASSSIARVRFILRGLAVQPPHKQVAKGKVKDPLYNQYALTTGAKEKASVNFKDGTILNLNQLTNVLLRSPSLTQIKKGEVEQQVVPGTNHSIQTPGAVASAIGTIFDVRVVGNTTIITVVEGSVLVSTKAGNVVVKTGEQTRVKKGQAPTPPQPVDAPSITRWTAPIPPPKPPLALNIALDANGGNIYRWTSQRDDPNHSFDAHSADDGRLDRGWQSAAGQVTEQGLFVRFQGLHQYDLAGIFLDCAATSGQGAANAAKDFEVLASDTGAASGFTPVYDGSCNDQHQLQVFPFSATVKATYLEVDFKNNHGGTEGIAVAELGVLSAERPATLGTPTPEPTDTPTPTPTNTPTPTVTPTSVPTATSTPTLVPTATSTPSPIPSGPVTFTPQSYPRCYRFTTDQYCGFAQDGEAFPCDQHPPGSSGPNSTELICGGTRYTASSCAQDGGPADCPPVVVVMNGERYLYVWAEEINYSSQPYQSNPGNFTLQGPSGTIAGQGTPLPNSTDPNNHGMVAKTIPGNATGQQAFNNGWIAFPLPGPGTYTLQWQETGASAPTAVGSYQVP